MLFPTHFFLSPTWMRVVHHINFSRFAIYLNIFHTNIVLMQFDLIWWHRNNIDMVEREIKITPYNCQCTIDRHFRWEKSNCTSLATKTSDSHQSITQKGECKKSMTRKEWNYQKRRLPSNCGYAIEKSCIFLYIAVKSIQFSTFAFTNQIPKRNSISMVFGANLNTHFLIWNRKAPFSI